MNLIKNNTEVMSISGGYKFPRVNNIAENKIVKEEMPEEVIISMNQGFGQEVTPVVNSGDKVKTGQIIGKDDKNISTPVLASITGIVKKNVDYNSEKAVIIESEGTEEWHKIENQNSAWKELSRTEIEDILYYSGMTGIGNRGIPTRHQSSDLSLKEAKCLIINGIEDLPFDSSLSLLENEDNRNLFFEGLMILKKFLFDTSIYLLLNKERENLIQNIQNENVFDEKIKIIKVSPKYPQSNPKILYKKVSEDKKQNQDLLVIDIFNVLQIYKAVVQGKPLIEQMIALTGSAWKKNFFLKCRIGTSIEKIVNKYLIDKNNSRLISGNILTEPKISDYNLPVKSGLTNLTAFKENNERQFLSFFRLGDNKDSFSRAYLSCFKSRSKRTYDTDLQGEEGPCIFCGYCEEVCPGGLIPHYLNKHIERNKINQKLNRYGIFDCIECNLCSFVCPAKRPIAQNIKSGKNIIQNS